MSAEALPELLAQEISLEAIDSIFPHPENTNEGDVGAIVESMEAVGGFYNVVFVQTSTRLIIAGEHRWRALAAKGSPVVPVIFLDLDDETVVRILVGDNEIPRRRSRSNDSALADLLTRLHGETEAGLAGTGFEGSDLDLLLADVARSNENANFDASSEWADGMPAFVQHNLNSKYRATVHFRNDEDADDFFRRIERPRRTSFWWPVEDDHVGSDVSIEYAAVDDEQ